MDFLTPVFAAVGLAAASIPVVLHMLRRAPTQKMPFSLVRFLKPSRPTLTKRSRIEHWPLMLLRMLALVLIGLAFARPFLREVIPIAPSDGEAQAVAVLVDASASMRRDGVREQVQSIIREVASELNDGDLFSLSEFSATSRPRITQETFLRTPAEERPALIEAVVEAYEPDWLHTSTGTAMRMAADELAQEKNTSVTIKRRRLIVITDFQRGSDLDELKKGDWPASVAVELKTVQAPKKGNAGVTLISDRRTDQNRVRISSAGDSLQQQYQLQPFDSEGNPVGAAISVSVAPGQRQSVTLPSTDAAAGKVIAGVELLGDEHPFDNVIDLPEADSPVVRVAHVGSSDVNDADSMRYYLQRVLDGNSERDVQVVDLIQSDGVVLPIPADVKLVIATEAVPESLRPSLTEFFARSGTMLAAVTSVSAADSLKTFLPDRFEVQEATVDDYAMLGQIDFQHPLFSSFADARFADFSSIRFWKHRNLSFPEEDRSPGDWTVAAGFDNGQPAIADVRVAESGRLILFASGWHPVDSQLALSTRFPPLITRIVTLSNPAAKDQLVQTVGDIIRPEDIVSTDRWTVRKPDGTVVTPSEPNDSQSPAAANSGSAVAPANPDSSAMVLNDPGRYVVTGITDDGERSVVLIAGLAASESNTEMLPLGQLQVLGIGAGDVSETSESELSRGSPDGQLNSSELERTQKWWRWLLLSGLTCLFVESLWAAQIAKRQAA
ncbi:MAG: BatA domain-containing protein [Planctomycetaceae bacterium]